MRIAILGGTGKEGSGLGFRWAAAGHEILIGSRLAEKGERAAAEMAAELPRAAIRGGDNLWAARQAELVALAVPYEAQARTLDEVKEALPGKILVTVVAPLGAPKARYHRLPSGLSAAEEAQQQIGESTVVVGAFQNISAAHLRDLHHRLDCDVLVCGDKTADKEIVIRLCADAGMRGINAGPLANSAVVEGLTALLLGINVRHKINDAGIRITGLPEQTADTY